jgi:ABC-type antimicrobial peptide transport system permease subunit
VVGVARNGKYQMLAERPVAFMYLPLWQSYRPDVVVQARTSADAGAAVASLRRAIQALDENLPLYEVKTAQAHLAFATFPQRLAGAFLGVFGALALLLASIGLYGVMAYLTAQRTREVGIRMALGASPGEVLRMVVRQGMGLAALGAACGVAGGLASAPLLARSRLLVGVSPTDFSTYLIAGLALAAAALAATAVPARRASRVDPVVALRSE